MKILDLIKSIYNTLYFNLKALKFNDAIRIPIICGPNICFNNIEKDRIHFVNGVSFKKIVIGRTQGSFKAGYRQRTYVNIGKNANIMINDTFDLPCGSTLNINGKLIIGKSFKPNCFLTISCEKEIVIGNNCNIGWNTTIIDGDGHPLCDLDNPLIEINKPRSVNIGDKCWISSHVSILKGVSLANNCIIPYGSIITKSCNQPYVIFGGIPNKIIKNNVARMDFIEN